MTALAFMAVVFVAWLQVLTPGFVSDPEEIAVLFAFILACSFVPLAIGWMANTEGNQLGRWRDWVPALTLMVLVVLAAFVAWIHTLIPLPVAKLLAVGLVILIAAERITRHMRREKPHRSHVAP